MKAHQPAPEARASVTRELRPSGVTALQQRACRSPQAKSLAAFQTMADRSPRVQLLAALQDTAETSPRVQQLQYTNRAIQRIDDEELLQGTAIQLVAAPGAKEPMGLPQASKTAIEERAAISLEHVRSQQNSSALAARSQVLQREPDVKVDLGRVNLTFDLGTEESRRDFVNFLRDLETQLLGLVSSNRAPTGEKGPARTQPKNGLRPLLSWFKDRKKSTQPNPQARRRSYGDTGVLEMQPERVTITNALYLVRQDLRTHLQEAKNAGNTDLEVHLNGLLQLVDGILNNRKLELSAELQQRGTNDGGDDNYSEPSWEPDEAAKTKMVLSGDNQ